MNTLTRLIAVAILVSSPFAADAAAVRVQNANYDAVGGKIIVKGLLDALPAGTGVTMTQVSNGRQLAVDNDGNKQFLFQVPIAAGQAAPCHLRIQAGNEQAYAEVRHSPTCSQQLLTLQGQVVDDPIPFATVTVTVGGVSYTTVADANGFYSLDIATATISELVTIEAVKRQTNGETIEFVSLAGSFSKLLADATGGVLSSETNQKVNVTNVSTAEYVLLVEANGGTAPTTVEELQQAETQVDATQLLELATIIKLIVDDGYALPSGYATVLSFVSNASATELDTFVASVEANDPAAFDNALQEILTSNGLVAGFRVEDVPGRYYVTSPTEPGFIARAGDVFEFSATRTNGCTSDSAQCDGYYMTRDVGGTPIGVATTWYISNGVLQVGLPVAVAGNYVSTLGNLLGVKPDAAMKEGGTLAECAPAGQISYRTRLTGISFTRFSDGQAIDALSRRLSLQYYDFLPVACANGEFKTVADFFVQSVGNVLARDSGAIAPRPFVAQATGAPGEIIAGGQWLLQVYANLNLVTNFSSGSGQVVRGIYTDNLSLNGDRTVTAYVAEELPGGPVPETWAVDAATGELVLAYSDGWTQRVLVTDAVDENGDGTPEQYGAFSVFTSPSGIRFGSSDPILRRDPTLSIDQATVGMGSGRYWQTMLNQWPTTAWEDFTVAGQTSRRLRASEFFGFVTAEPQAGYRGSFASPTTQCPSGRWSRQLLTGYSISGIGTTNVMTMDYLGFSGTRSRQWSVASVDIVNGERRLNVLEIEKLSAYGYAHYFPPRANFYREYVAPDISRGLCAIGDTPTP